MQSDVEKAVNEILNLDPKKQFFYLAVIAVLSAENVTINAGACNFSYTEFYDEDDDTFKRYNIININNESTITLTRSNGIIVYDDAGILGAKIVSALPGEVLGEASTKLTLYYREI